MIDNTRRALCLRFHWFAFHTQKVDRNIFAMILTEIYDSQKDK